MHELRRHTMSKKHLTVGELRKRLQDLDDDTLVAVRVPNDETDGYYVNASSLVITPNDLTGFLSVCLHPIYEPDKRYKIQTDKATLIYKAKSDAMRYAYDYLMETDGHVMLDIEVTIDEDIVETFNLYDSEAEDHRIFACDSCSFHSDYDCFGYDEDDNIVCTDCAAD